MKENFGEGLNCNSSCDRPLVQTCLSPVGPGLNQIPGMHKHEGWKGITHLSDSET